METLDVNATSGDDSPPPPMTSEWSVYVVVCLGAVAGVTGAGNILICLAISLDRRLHTITNYILMSLALADLAVAFLVMPPAILILYLGYWPFGLFGCALWSMADVLMCTSSIMHLCAVSVDRYLAIAYPISHNVHKTLTTVLLKVAGVWVISIVISCPVLILSLTQPATLAGDQCRFHHRNFMIYGSVVAFYIPLVVMLVLYSRTIRILTRKASLIRTCGNEDRAKAVYQKMTQTTEIDDKSPTKSHYCKNNSPRKKLEPPQSPIYQLKSDSSDRIEVSPSPIRKDSVTFSRPSSPKHMPSTPVLRIASRAHQRKTVSMKNKSRDINNERKASKFLGVVFLMFCVCWLPFFLCNTLSAVCLSCQRYLSDTLFNLFLWLGYCSSMVNPMIYVVFNKRFREAFKNVLLCRYFSKQFVLQQRMRNLEHAYQMNNNARNSAQNIQNNSSSSKTEKN